MAGQCRSATTASALRLLASIVEFSEDAIISGNTRGEILSWNAAAERMYGYVADEVKGRHIDLLVPEGLREEYRRNIERVATGIPVEYETTRLRKDGSALDVHLNLSPIRDADGNITGISGIARDITERLQTAKKLERSQALFQQITESIGEVFWLIDASSRKIVYASPAFERIWGRSCESIYSAPNSWIETIHPEDCERATAVFQEQLKGDREANEYRIIRPDGSVRFIRDRAFPVRDDDGQLVRIAGVAEDITRQKESEAALIESQLRIQCLVDSDVVGIFRGDDSGQIKDANDRFLSMLGYSREDLGSSAIRWTQIAAPGNEATSARILRELDTTGRARPAETEYRRKDGSRAPVLVGLALLHTGARSAIGFVLDRTEQKQAQDELRRSEQKFRQFAESMREVLWLVSVETGEMLYVSPAYEEIWQRKAEALYRNPADWIDAIHADDRDVAESVFRRQLIGEIVDNEYRIVQPGGAVRWIRDRAFPVRNEEGRIVRLGGVAEDITERKVHDAWLVHQASHDQLTNLPNRRLLLEELEQAMKLQPRDGDILAVLCIDLDRFKLVNDSMGHAAGDQLLRGVATRLCEAVRSGDTVARVGGDEFTLVAPGFATKEAVRHFAEKLLTHLHQPFRIDGLELFIGASIGISLFPGDGEDSEVLQRNADTAAHESKQAGKDQVTFFSRRLAEETRKRVAMHTQLRQAMACGEFRLEFQPQFARHGGAVVRFEALLRWDRPEGESISPAKFIPLAEECGLIRPIGEWVLVEACREAARWQSGERRGVGVAVNVSARQFASTDLIPMVSRALECSGLPASLLEIELTESVFIGDLEESAKKLMELKKLGVTIALDDFGTGYSSLSYLRNLPIDVIKLDRSFLAEVGLKGSSEAVIRCLIELAHALGIRVIAEGVETTDHFDLLHRLGCDEMQGFLLGRPVSGLGITDAG